MIPPPCVVASHVHIQSVVSIGFQKLRSLKAFLQVTTLLLELLVRKSTLSPIFEHTLGTEAHRHREVPAAGLRDFLADLFRKSEPVLQASAVLIGSVIEKGDGELIDEITLMNRVNLYTVKTSTLRVKRALSKAFYNLVNFVPGKFPTGLVKPTMGNGRGSYRRELSQICRNCHTPKSA